MGASPVDADLESDAPLSLPAIDAVVHAAALFRFSGPRAPFFRTKVDGTAALLKAAETAGAKTFVYISAAGVIMDDAGAPTRLNGGAVASVQHIGESVTAIWVAAKGVARIGPSSPTLAGMTTYKFLRWMRRIVEHDRRENSSAR